MLLELVYKLAQFFELFARELEAELVHQRGLESLVLEVEQVPDNHGVELALGNLLCGFLPLW